MKALTLHQPWATLVASGVKTIETRSWQTSYRGPLAIHAGKRWPTVEESLLLESLGWPPIACLLALARKAPAIPYGAVVATCELIDCAPSVREGEAPDFEGRHVLVIHSDGTLVLDDPRGRTTDVSDQRPYGEYAEGRWAWVLADVRAIEPAPAKGRQGLWEWTET